MQTTVSTPPALPLGTALLKEEAIAKFKSKTASVGVIGLGYVGLPLALLFSEEGFRVTGFDIDNTKIDMLASSRSYICRIPETEIALARDRGFQATARYRFRARQGALGIAHRRLRKRTGVKTGESGDSAQPFELQRGRQGERQKI